MPIKDTGWVMRTGVRRDPRSYGKVVIDQEDVDLIRKSFVKAVKAALHAVPLFQRLTRLATVQLAAMPVPVSARVG